MTQLTSQARRRDERGEHAFLPTQRKRISIIVVRKGTVNVRG